MTTYEVYATRFDDPHIVEELIPAKGLEFSLPLSDHGQASFTATVEPGKSFWRPALALPISGVLIARDGVPWWQGCITDERPAGARSFSFTCREWGYFFEEKVQAVARSWNEIDDHTIIRNLIADAQAIPGQNLQVTVDPTTVSAHTSTRTVNPWDITTVGRELRNVAETGAAEWYFGTSGTLDNPTRPLILGDRLGQTAAEAVLEYVEDTVPYVLPSPPPMVALLGDLFPGAPTAVPTRRAGGNVIAQGRTRALGNAATVVEGIGPGKEAATVIAPAKVATNLLNQGWPRMTSRISYADIMPAVNGRYYIPAVLRRMDGAMAADLAKVAGIATTYSLVTLDGDAAADWTQTPRGSTVRVILDTDIYGAERPVGGPNGFDARLIDTVVRVPDSGPAQVEWVTSTVLDVS